MIKITDFFISAGHSVNPKRDMGAISGSRIEGVYTAEARVLLVNAMIQRGYAEGITDIKDRIHVDGDDSILADTLRSFTGKTTETSLLIDIHFNAANGKAAGVEVLIPDNYTSSELEIADRISDIFGVHIGTPERGDTGGRDGVKTESDSQHTKLGWMRLPGINILIEAEFIDNDSRMAVYDQKKQTVWDYVAAYVVGLMKQSL